MAVKKETKRMKYKVTAPVEDFCGIGAGGVQFAYGEAEVYGGWVLDWYREHGFGISEIGEEKIEAPVETAEEVKE